MTVQLQILTLVGLMFTDAQIQYLEDVLGASVGYFSVAPLDAAEAETGGPPVAVVTPKLGTAEHELLGKILGSVKLTRYLHVEIEDPTTLPADLRASHALMFFGGAARDAQEDCVWWRLPSLEQMVSREGAAFKKQAWGLLQLFAKEQG
ncbi:MAG TPA: hypothetical protein PKC28_04180 [Bdellovibrionales bacterium]|nr:hypothetical protein [Bdellovibrionales bacterium]